MKNDLELRRDVLDELEWEPSIDAAEIGVAVKDSIVTLTGPVKSYTEKLTAGGVAERVKDVKAIANDIEVRLPGTAERTDADIAQAAFEALKWKTTVPDGRIKVSVSKGWVTLEGEVDWQYQRYAAVEAVHHLVGVKGVTNLIALKPWASATEVKSRIEGGVPAQRRAGCAEGPGGDSRRQGDAAGRRPLLVRAAGSRTDGLVGPGCHAGREPHRDCALRGTERVSGSCAVATGLDGFRRPEHIHDYSCDLGRSQRSHQDRRGR